MIIGRVKHYRVELQKGADQELSACVAKSSPGRRSLDIEMRAPLIEMELNGLEGLLGDEQNNSGQRELAFTSEILREAAVSGSEGGVGKFQSQRVDELEGSCFGVM